MNKLKKVIEANQEDLEKMNDQRRAWLWASSIVFWAIIVIIFAWDWIDGLNSKSVWWFIVSCMLILSINWWYWTMRIIRKLIAHQNLEYNVLISILKDIGKIKQDVKELGVKSIDKSK